jgi:hypothetical protein
VVEGVQVRDDVGPDEGGEGLLRPSWPHGEFSFVHTLNLASKGNLYTYTAETIGGRRVQRFRVVGRHH